MLTGIDDISFYTSSFYLDLKTLANVHNVDPAKYHKGLWQEKMSIPAPDEDIVTMAANAANPIIERIGTDSISTLMFATETGIDQSKSAGVYVHRLLNLNPNCRVVELKQACYSSTAAIQMACALVAQQPEKKVLVIASDVARYNLNTPAEATQGCGAVAILISANPRIMSISPLVGNHTEDVMDFWRPNYFSTALVNGKYSTEVYLESLKHAWQNFVDVSAQAFSDFSHFCYHLPFSRMGEKAHKHLAKLNNSELSDAQLHEQIADTVHYNRAIGNTYTASLYIGLSSLLENCSDNLDDKKIGFFSYGSGCVSEFFFGTVSKGYQAYLHGQKHWNMLNERTEVNHQEYLDLYNQVDTKDGQRHDMPCRTSGGYRLSAINEHKREYIAC